MTKVGELLGGGNDTREQMAKVLELEGKLANVRNYIAQFYYIHKSYGFIKK